MGIIQAIILGLIQGLTEFIPVSSSGHLVLAHHLLGIAEHGLAYDVALHFGTLVALVAYFWKDLLGYARSLIKKDDNTRLAYLLIAATVPAAVIGYLLESKAESQFRSVRLVGLTMLVFGAIMLLAEYYYRRQAKHTKLDDIQTPQALAMGFAQAIAILPGVSRSGSTITAGLFMGLDRIAATRFSFLLGIPITAGAGLKVLVKNSAFSQIHSETGIFITGVLAAFITGMFAIKFMLSYLAKHSLATFAYYRMGLAALVLAVLVL